MEEAVLDLEVMQGCLMMSPNHGNKGALLGLEVMQGCLMMSPNHGKLTFSILRFWILDLKGQWLCSFIYEFSLLQSYVSLFQCYVTVLFLSLLVYALKQKLFGGSGVGSDAGLPYDPDNGLTLSSEEWPYFFSPYIGVVSFLVLLFDLIGMLLGSFYGFYVWFMFGHKFLYTVMFYTVMLCFSLLISSNSSPFRFMYVAEIIKRTKIWSLLMNGNKIKWVQIYNFTYSISIPKTTPMTTTCPLHWKHSKKSFWDLNMTWRKSRLTNNNH